MRSGGSSGSPGDRSLRSPHTIAIFDFGVADDGTFYFVMELLDGVDLEALVSASVLCQPRA